MITYFNAGGTDVPGVRVGHRPCSSVPPQVNVVASAIFLVSIGIALANVAWQHRTAKRHGASYDSRRDTDPARRQRPPLDALHADGRLRRRRRADHRARRRLLPRGRERAPLPDALAGLFSVNIGYSFGEEMGQAALDQMRELPFYTNWSYAHPRAIELATEISGARAR